MILEEIVNLLEARISPAIFNIESELYGIQYQPNKNKNIIKKVLISTELSIKAIHFAIMNKINLIISLYGLIEKPIQFFDAYLVDKLNLLSQYPISIFVLGSSIISAEGGVSDTITDILYLKNLKPLCLKNNQGNNVPIGRFCTPNFYYNQKKRFIFEDLLKRVKNNLDLKVINYVGDLNREINNICVVGIESIDDSDLLMNASKSQCDCYISSIINHKKAIIAVEVGLCLIEIPLFNIKSMMMKKLYNYLSLEFPKEEFFFFNPKNYIKNY